MGNLPSWSLKNWLLIIKFLLMHKDIKEVYGAFGMINLERWR